MSLRESLATRLADGRWHRLHPATPLLKGGIAFVAILGIILVNLRDFLIQLVLDGPGGYPGQEYDPITWIITHDYAGLVILGVVAGLLLFIAGFFLSWRMHTFRITQEQVEVRSGILFRTNRRARLDRIQGINVGRPFLARLFGAARLEISVAGQDANVELAYLASGAADELRREILLLASGSRAEREVEQAPAAQPDGAGIVERRLNELLAPELDPDAAPPESVVQLHLGRLIGSLLLSGFTVVLLGMVVALIVLTATTGKPVLLLGFVPALIGMSGYYISKFTRSLRYSIASTPDGVRVGFGLLSTSNETLPPGRIHAVRISQPLLWRPAGWWEVRINRASSSSARGAAGQAQTTILPVGDRGDVTRVLELLLPGLAESGTLALVDTAMTSTGGGDGFVTSPRRAWVLRWFSWRRNGLAIVPGAVLLRRGAIWRDLVIVPQARMQSILLRQGPLLRRLRLASLALHTVAGPVPAGIGAIDQDQAVLAFGEIADAAVSSARTDTSHRWRASVPAPDPAPAAGVASGPAAPSGSAVAPTAGAE